MSRTLTALVASLVAGVLAPAVVSAQQTEPLPAVVRRPYRGLFATPADPRKPSLDLRFSLFSAHDNSEYTDDQRPSNGLLPNDVRTGWFHGGSAGVVFARPSERVSFELDGDVGASYYGEQQDVVTAYRTGGNVSIKATSTTVLAVGASLSYSPEYRMGLYAGAGSPLGIADPFGTISPDLDLYRLKAYRSTGQVELTQQLGRRGSLKGWYNGSRVSYNRSDLDYQTESAGGSFLHQLTRNAGLRLGYYYSTANYTDRANIKPQRLHNIDAGVDYARALSVSRRTTLSFSTGSALLVRDDVLTVEQGQDLLFELTGTATLNREIGRSWNAHLGYRRGINFNEGFSEPFLSNSVNAGADGLISSRLHFAITADYAFGTVGVDSDNRYGSLNGSADLQYALARRLALFARYVYYQYDFDQDVAIDPRFVRTFDRQGVRFGLDVFVPVFGKRGQS